MRLLLLPPNKSFPQTSETVTEPAEELTTEPEKEMSVQEKKHNSKMDRKGLFSRKREKSQMICASNYLNREVLFYAEYVILITRKYSGGIYGA